MSTRTVAQRHQSPINIDTKNTVDINVGPLKFLYRPRKSDGGNQNIFKHGLGRNAEVKNIGHGFSVTRLISVLSVPHVPFGAEATRNVC